MSSRIAGTAVYNVAKRQMAAQAAAATKSLPGSSDVKVSTLDNGLTVVSAESPTGACTLGVIGRCGPRNEVYENMGVSNTLRVASGLANSSHSLFGMTKNLAQLGTELHCSGDSEMTVYWANMLRENVDEVSDFIIDGICSQLFYPWELQDIVYPKMKVILESLPPCEHAKELLLKAAYRNGLGNCNYVQSHKIGSHHTYMLRDFFAENFTSNRAAIVGLGMGHDEVTKLGIRLNLAKGAGKDGGKTTYYGGEQRAETGGQMATVMIGAEVAPSDAVAAEILANVWGSGPFISIRNASTGGGKVQKEVNGCAMGFNFNFTDSAIVGIGLSVQASEAGKACEAAAAAMRSGSISEADLSAAKKQVISKVLADISSNNGLGAALGKNAVGQSQIGAAADPVGTINAVSLGDVQAVAKKLASSKLSMSAVGNLSTVPYVDSL